MVLTPVTSTNDSLHQQTPYNNSPTPEHARTHTHTLTFAALRPVVGQRSWAIATCHGSLVAGACAFAVAAAVVGVARTRTRIALLVETDNIRFITSPEHAETVVTGDAQFVFVIEQNTEVLSCTHLLHATIDDFHKFVSLGFVPSPS